MRQEYEAAFLMRSTRVLSGGKADRITKDDD